MSFNPLPIKVDFPAMEREILKWWEESGIVGKYLEKNKTSDKKYSFLDGPITANNPMGVHHAWGRTYKDLWQRFMNMQNYRQRFQNGFDNQGLWVEVEVEKELGFKSKKDIEDFGIENFVNKCKERTIKYAQIQTEQSKRLGYFMDWDNSYFTMSDENNYMNWHFLKKCFEQGLIYKGRDSVPWCPRCGTAISQHEISTEEYKELTHKSVFLKLPRIEVTDNSYFLVWTTTPWTIPGNVALAVNPELTYAEFTVEETGEILIFVKDLATRVLGEKGWKIKREFLGSELAGQHYSAPFDDLPNVLKAKEENSQRFHSVVLDKDLVSSEEGTGIVHIAPGAGEEDFALGKKENLPVVEIIDGAANYLAGFGDFTDKNAKDNPELVFTALEQIGKGKFLFKLEDYTHRYPVCWRCKSELVWRVVEEWYIGMEKLRYGIMDVAKKINWLPKWGLDRELDWLKNMGDWLISKKRYWGLALPIWECTKCGNFEVIGGKEELQERAVEGWDKFEGNSPHRPWVDEVKIKCSKCGEIVSRIPDVGNPWLDAGIVPYSTLNYRTDKKYWKEWFPPDFITESFPGQFKNWFYSLLTMSTVLEKTNPFKNVLGYASVRDEKGEEMHKSKGNAIDFSEAAETMGVDVMRWMYVTQNPENNLNFGYQLADETRRRFHLLIWNIYNFFVTYANIDRWGVEQPAMANQTAINVLDKWITSRLDQLIGTVTGSLSVYDAFTASRSIEDFVNELSTWYVRRSRDRIGPTAEDNKDKKYCYLMLYHILLTLSQLLAPFIPFLSEAIYKNLTDGQSVHLGDWPSAKSSVINLNLIEEMKIVRKICEFGHAARKKDSIKVRQPLRLIKVKINKLKLSEELIQLIKDELNVKNIEWTVIKTLEPEVELETTLSSELIEEGEARELVRKIQELRKEQNLALDQKISLVLPSFPKSFEDYIKRETLAEKIEIGSLGVRPVQS